MSEDGERIATLEATLKALEARLEKVEKNLNTGALAVLVTVIGAVLSLVIKK